MSGPAHYCSPPAWNVLLSPVEAQHDSNTNYLNLSVFQSAPCARIYIFPYKHQLVLSSEGVLLWAIISQLLLRLTCSLCFTFSIPVINCQLPFNVKHGQYEVRNASLCSIQFLSEVLHAARVRTMWLRQEVFFRWNGEMKGNWREFTVEWVQSALPGLEKSYSICVCISPQAPCKNPFSRHKPRAVTVCN